MDVSVDACDEWSPLKSIIIGRAGKACFPWADPKMIQATMPAKHQHNFRPGNPFPPEIIANAEAELDSLAQILQDEGVRVYRPPQGIDWHALGGYTGAMPRDGLMSIGNTLIEACFAWPSRDGEIETAYGDILAQLGQDPRVTIVRRQPEAFAHTLLESSDQHPQEWIINNSRPAFDVADFMRFGKVIIGQYSHVTNAAGVDYVRQHLPSGYSLEILQVNDPSAMHIDATILPLRHGLLVYNPTKVTLEGLRAHSVLKDWQLEPYPFVPEESPDGPPLYMTSPWLPLNVLVLDGKKVIVEASDERTAKWYETLGMECIPCPFKHVNSIGGSFHCATVDLVRQSTTKTSA